MWTIGIVSMKLAYASNVVVAVGLSEPIYWLRENGADVVGSPTAPVMIGVLEEDDKSSVLIELELLRVELTKKSISYIVEGT